MANFLTAYGGRILTFLILALSALTTAAKSLGLNEAAVAWIDLGAAFLKIADEVFIGPDQKQAAIVAMRTPTQVKP